MGAALLLLFAALADRPKSRPAAEKVSVAPTTLTTNQSNAEVVNFLGILQEKGRLVDFLMDDVKGYSDAEVGAAARDRDGKGLEDRHRQRSILPSRRHEFGECTLVVRPGAVENTPSL